jgi:cytochrome c oxidase cbb3-type subunit 2
MPSFRDSLPEQDRWALAYYVLSLSAFTDPLTGEPLKISAATRKALDDPKLQASTPEEAYIPAGGEKSSASAADMASVVPAGALLRTSGDAVPQKSE